MHSQARAFIYELHSQARAINTVIDTLCVQLPYIVTLSLKMTEGSKIRDFWATWFVNGP